MSFAVFGSEANENASGASRISASFPQENSLNSASRCDVSSPIGLRLEVLETTASHTLIAAPRKRTVSLFFL